MGGRWGRFSVNLNYFHPSISYQVPPPARSISGSVKPRKSLLPVTTIGMSGTNGTTKEQGKEEARLADRMLVNVFENVLAGEASRQVIVSTTGIRISASTVTTEARAMQCLGRLSDTSISQISQDHMAVSISQQEAKGGRHQTLERYEGTYGAGKTL